MVISTIDSYVLEVSSNFAQHIDVTRPVIYEHLKLVVNASEMTLSPFTTSRFYFTSMYSEADCSKIMAPL